ncbi:hypothetical protein BGX38DRAFT_418497 [Terfezia claveryi]|nr:hypothetical protein BGX38DRAFT_418497 [Terfezia claveryi]
MPPRKSRYLLIFFPFRINGALCTICKVVTTPTGVYVHLGAAPERWVGSPFPSSRSSKATMAALTIGGGDIRESMRHSGGYFLANWPIISSRAIPQ